MIQENSKSSVLAEFRRSAESWPDRTAVVSGEVSLTFAELADRVERLSAVLRSLGIGPEQSVVSCLAPSAGVPVAMLGVWSAGGTYVPLDLQVPSDRLRYVLDDCRAQVLIVAKGTAVDQPGVRIVELDDTGAPVQVAPERFETPVTPAPNDLSYIIYTSGSTGRPKGVLVEHGNLAEMTANYEAALYGPLDRPVRRICVNNPLITDSAVSDLVHIAFGRTLYFVSPSVRRDPDRMAAFLTEHRIELLDATPTQIRALLMAGHADALRSLRVLIVGGESTDSSLWAALQGLEGVAVFNLYGPTECTVAVTFADVRADSLPTIGAEFPNCPVFLLDDGLRPVPDGETGEICVSGVQVARGYLNAPEQQADRFVSFTPPGQSEAVRIYRTGDRARRTAAGTLEFFGRTDDQVKIRGYRVELGELEAVLRQCHGVFDAAAALDRTDSEPVLRAFVVLAGGTSEAEVQQYLKDTLPAHMLPRLSTVPGIPSGPTGKADRKALLAALADGGAEAVAVTAPPQGSGDPRVDLLRDIWCQVLHLTDVAADDDFFTLGGDSLKATRMTLKVRKQLTAAAPVSAVFEHPDFRGYCAAITALR
ncbi:non-ribosomal peptide synthetase [Kitasatospora griseola]